MLAWWYAGSWQCEGCKRKLVRRMERAGERAPRHETETWPEGPYAVEAGCWCGQCGKDIEAAE